MRIFIFGLTLLILLSCTTIVAPPRDFPVLPEPGALLLESVTVIVLDHDGESGIWLSDAEFQKVARNLGKVKAENESLRIIIHEYNLWVMEQEND